MLGLASKPNAGAFASATRGDQRPVPRCLTCVSQVGQRKPAQNGHLSQVSQLSRPI
jgi:hypothetical protein